MSWERKAIRWFLQNRLKGRTRAGNDVGTTRTPNIPGDARHTLTVYTAGEQGIEPFDTLGAGGRRRHKVPLRIFVELFSDERREDGSSVEGDDLVDDFCEEVLRVLDPALHELGRIRGGGDRQELDVLLEQTYIEGWEAEFSSAGERLEGAARLTVLVTYIRLERSPDSKGKIGPFLGADVDFDLPPMDTEPEIEATIDLEQP